MTASSAAGHAFAQTAPDKEANPYEATSKAADAKATPPSSSPPASPPAEPAPAAPESPPPQPPPVEEPRPPTGFAFGSYGRMIAAGDLRGGPGRDSNIVAHGSRLDEGNYVELELRRDDLWNVTKTGTRLVATLAVASPVFHYTGNFNIQMRCATSTSRRAASAGRASRSGPARACTAATTSTCSTTGRSTTSTPSAAARATTSSQNTYIAAQYGIAQPTTDFFVQSVVEPQPLNNPGAANVLILNRQELEGSLKSSHIVRVGETGGDQGRALHRVSPAAPRGSTSSRRANTRSLPGDLGWVVGAQVGAFSGKRDNHVNLFVRYAGGLAAYGDFTTPDQLAADKTTNGARGAGRRPGRQLRDRRLRPDGRRVRALVPQRRPVD